MLARTVVAVPELVVSAVAGFSVGPMALLLAGHFERVPVLVAGLAGALIAAAACGVRDTPAYAPAAPGGAGGTPGLPEPKLRSDVWCTLVALALVTVWFLVNAPYTAENLYTTRDPATYNVAARWLMDNPSLHIPVHPEVFGTPAGYLSGSPGFADVHQPLTSGELAAQGDHLMPAMAAILGWIAGVGAMFRANLLLGAIALLALFALARRIVGGPLALLVTAAMAVSIPMIYVSRDMYSEPLMMLFLIGGTALLHRAICSGRRIDFAVAGLVAGCAAMARVDSYVALLAIALSVVLLACVEAPGARRKTALDGLALLGVGAVPIALGLLDVTRLSPGYYHDQHHDIVLELLALAAVLALSPVVVWIAWRPGVRHALRSDGRRARLATGAIALVVALFLVLVSRPLWLVGRYPYNQAVALWQRLGGVTVDGTRSYNERTVLWLVDYFGWPTVLAAVVGYSLLIVAFVRRRAYPLVGTLTIGLVTSSLYLWNARITPDQPWAIRRYVAVVIPILLVAAGTAVRALAARGRVALAASVVLGALMVGFPAVVSWPMRTTRDEVPEYGQVQALCSAMGPRAALVVLDTVAYNGFGPPVRSYCGVPAIGLVDATPAQLAQVRADVARHGRELYVLASDAAPVSFAPGASRVPFSSVNTQLWPNVINHAPTGPGHRLTELWLGQVDESGLAAAVR